MSNYNLISLTPSYVYSCYITLSEAACTVSEIAQQALKDGVQERQLSEHKQLSDHNTQPLASNETFRESLPLPLTAVNRKEIHEALKELYNTINSKDAVTQSEATTFNNYFETLRIQLTKTQPSLLEQIFYLATRILKLPITSSIPFLLTEIENQIRSKTQPGKSEKANGDIEQALDDPTFRNFFLNLFGLPGEQGNDYSIAKQSSEGNHFTLTHKKSQKIIDKAELVQKLGIPFIQAQLLASTIQINFPESLPFTVEKNGDELVLFLNAAGEKRKDPDTNIVLKIGSFYAKIERLVYNAKTRTLTPWTVAMALDKKPVELGTVDLSQGAKAPVFLLFKNLHSSP